MSNTTNHRTDIEPSSSNEMALTDIPEKISPDVILRQIDQIKQSVRESESQPGLLQRITSSDARKRNAAIEEARIESVKANTVLIKGLSSSLSIYIETHKNHFKSVSAAFLTAQFNRQMASLDAASSETIITMLQTYKTSTERIERMGLPDDKKQLQLDEAWRRVLRAQIRQEENFNKIIDEINKQIQSMIQDMRQL